MENGLLQAGDWISAVGHARHSNVGNGATTVWLYDGAASDIIEESVGRAGHADDVFAIGRNSAALVRRIGPPRSQGYGDQGAREGSGGPHRDRERSEEQSGLFERSIHRLELDCWP